MQKLRRSATLTFWLCATAGTVLTQLALEVFQLSIQLWIPWMLAAAFTTVCLYRAIRCRDRRTLVFSGIYAAAMAAMFLLGSRFTFTPPFGFKGIGLRDIPHWLGLALALWAVFICVFEELTRHPFPSVKQSGQLKWQKARSWAIWSAIFVAAWLPYWFIYYPGLLTGDSFYCLVRASGWAAIDNQQPALYQLFLRLFMGIGNLAGNINTGVAVYSLTQILIMASILGYALYWCRRHGCPRPYLWLVTAFFAINPIYPKYAITMWKDVMFGGFVLLFILFLFDTAKQRGENLMHWRGIVHFCLLSLAVAFLRNNGIYVLFCTFIVLAIYCRRFWKRIVPVTAALLIFNAVIQGPVYDALKMPKNHIAESLGIPLQQVACAVANDGKITDEQKAYLNQLLPLDEMKQAYYPYTTDRIKFHKNFNNEFLEKNLSGFFKVWAGMLLPNFKDYCRAYLMETLGYWNVGTARWVTAPGINSGTDDTKGIVNHDLIRQATGIDLKPRVEQINSLFTRFTPTAMLNNIAVMVWITLFLMLFALARRRWKHLPMLMPLVGLWLSLMVAAPTYCEFRYMFSFFLAMPFLIFGVLCRDEGNENQPEETTKVVTPTISE